MGQWLSKIIQFPVRSPLLSVAWFIGGMIVLSELMAGGMQGPTSAASQRIDFVMRSTGPVGAICLLATVLGIVAGPWCLLARFLGAVDRKQNPKGK